MINDQNQTSRIFMRNIALNLILAVGKLLTGAAAGSGALLSDGVDSASDVFSTLVAMTGVKLAGRASDEDHPFGHERFECIASLILALMLAVSGAGIGLSGVRKIFSADQIIEAPGMLALIAAAVSVAVKAMMSVFTRAAGKKFNSSALKADALNYQSDALASLGVLGGVLGARLGLPILDPIASLVICLFIFKAVFIITRDAFRRMTDTSCDSQTQTAMRELIASVEGVQGIDRLSTRLFGNRIYAETEISVDGSVSLNEAHAISHKVHDAIEQQFPTVKHCMVHVNPTEDTRTDP